MIKKEVSFFRHFLFCRIRKNSPKRYIIIMIRKLLVYILFLLCALGVSQAQSNSSVLFTNITVTDSGTVDLQWSYSNNNSGIFMYYFVGRFNSFTNNYDTVALISNVSTQQCTDTIGNAYADSLSYIIFAVNNIDTAIDSVITICPSVVNVMNQSEYAYISWNKPFPAAAGRYTVYRKMPNSAWTMVSTTFLEHYQDTIRYSICSDTIFYKIIFNDTNRRFISSMSGAWFTDRYPTTPCSLEVISVDTATQDIILSWQPSPDPDIMGYFICQGTPCMALDTVWGQYNTTYTCTTRSIDSINSFRLYAFDSCYSASALTNPYNNVVLTLRSQHCTRNIDFSWNEYINMPDGVGQYTLFLKYDNAPYRSVATVPASSRGMSYIIPAGVRQVWAYLQIINTSNTKFAFSNIKTFDMATVDTAEFIHTLAVSVDDEGVALQLKFLVDTHFAATGYTLYRRVDAGSFQNHRVILPTGNSTIDFVDVDVDLSEHQYAYFIGVWDECGLLEKTSCKVSQIYATLSHDEGTNIITWTPYNGEGILSGYNLLRKTEKEPLWKTICNTQGTQIADNTVPYGRVWYRVEAEYTNPDNNRRCTALSQIVENHGEPIIWLPNIFTPKRDNNNRFLPKTMFVRSDGYLMRIYNRFGLLVFETSDINEPWDGCHKGKIVPSGGYVYIIQYIGDNNNNEILKGTVTVFN